VRAIVKQAINLNNFGAKVVLVHGGGKQITDELKAAGIEANFEDGVRLTDAPTLEITDKCLNTLNRQIAVIFQQEAAKLRANVFSQTMSGYDGGIVFASPKFEGYLTGTAEGVNAEYLEGITSRQTVPIIYPICLGENGQRMNVNADEVAASLAKGLGAERLIICSNTAGVLDAQMERIPQLTKESMQELISSGVITDGMIPKVKAACDVADHPSVGGVVLLDGNDPTSVERELLSDVGAGTLFLSDQKKSMGHEFPWNRGRKV